MDLGPQDVHTFAEDDVFDVWKCKKCKISNCIFTLQENEKMTSWNFKVEISFLKIKVILANVYEIL